MGYIAATVLGLLVQIPLDPTVVRVEVIASILHQVSFAISLHCPYKTVAKQWFLPCFRSSKY